MTQTPDDAALVARLRGYAHNGYRSWLGIKQVFQEAADALEAKDRRIAELEAALRPFADHADFYTECEQHPNGCPDGALVGEVTDLTVGNFRRARATLEPSPPQV